MRALELLAASLGLFGCSSSTDTLATTGCDPLVPDVCGLPFPSNAWLVDDPATPTGHHVQFGPQTLQSANFLRTGVIENDCGGVCTGM